MNYRSDVLRGWARGVMCTMFGPYCNHDPSTSVWAHSNHLSHGKGRGIKSHDFYGAIVCSGCHDWYDGRIGGDERDDEKPAYFNDAMDRTLKFLFLIGALVAIPPGKNKPVGDAIDIFNEFGGGY